MPGNSPQGNPRPKLRSADRYYSNLREYKGVEFGLHDIQIKGAHGVGIGRKFVEGKPTGQLALRYYVAKKLPKDMLNTRETIPESIRYVSRKDGRSIRLPTDVVEAPPAQFEAFDPDRPSERAMAMYRGRRGMA